MTKRSRPSGLLSLLLAGVLAAALTLGLSACGSSSNSSSGSATNASDTGGVTASSPTVTVLMGTAPDSLDPALGVSTQSYEATWLAYTGLVTYAHASGAAGAQLIPGLATSLPTISADGKTYTFVLRKGLLYANGEAVKASDFAYTLERAIKLGWGNKQFLTGHIVGAEAFDAGKAHSISGIAANDATGGITVKLTAPFGPFLNVLAFPAAGLVPASTPMKPLPNNPPAGVGPYTIVHVVPNQSFGMAGNPHWASEAISGIPGGHTNIDVNIVTNNQSSAEQVLNNTADVFDWNDTVPGTLLPRVHSQAASRYAQEPTVSTEFFFLNTQAKPFSSQLAREAVNYALDRRALSRLDGGQLTPACYLLPIGMPGHPNGPCPYGDPNEPVTAANFAKAKELITQSGMAGTSVNVWSESHPPHKEYADYYASVLNSIGLKATVKIVAAAQYPATIGNIKNVNPQTGWIAFSQDFPNPVDFYQLLDAESISPTENHNLSQVNDPHIQSELAALSPVPSSKLNSVVPKWQALDEYTAQKAYIAVLGYDDVPKFTSERINFGALVFHPVYGNDWSTLQLK
ncbi:MAG TPA: ABC transporter substrate-binding protein [Solirubrobacteraceae bacterium]